MTFHVHIIRDAEDDIFHIYRYISLNDSIGNAEYVFEKIQQTCDSLSQNPERGHYPPELEQTGILEYREIHFKPYRIIYNIAGRDVLIHCILDGRRDLQELLERRLLR